MWGFATVTCSDLILSYSGPIMDHLNGGTWWVDWVVGSTTMTITLARPVARQRCPPQQLTKSIYYFDRVYCALEQTIPMPTSQYQASLDAIERWSDGSMDAVDIHDLHPQ